MGFIRPHRPDYPTNPKRSRRTRALTAEDLSKALRYRTLTSTEEGGMRYELTDHIDVSEDDLRVIAEHGYELAENAEHD